MTSQQEVMVGILAINLAKTAPLRVILLKVKFLSITTNWSSRGLFPQPRADGCSSSLALNVFFFGGIHHCDPQVELAVLVQRSTKER